MSIPLGESNPVAAPSNAERVWLEFLAALHALAPEAQAAFVLHEVFETSYVDIAELIGQPEDLCRAHVERARVHALALRRRPSGDRDEASHS
ncbi:sigma factor-like helix-turn-helix DNA-binding protein [Lysobacter sp. 1R34A]|uniref:sigma factor-like helix-turn-helix DNA-binding protein n=1 Tax=Lysobacter sp. 1R34A TaxID=3445786 RepID=UPI003EEFAA9A